MLIVEFVLDHPILRTALRQAPDVTVTWCRTDGLGERPGAERATVLCWVEGDAAGFADAVEADPTATDFCVVETLDDRSLCQFALTEYGRETSIYPTLVRVGGVVRALSSARDGWQFELAFPSQAGFDEFRDVCAERGFDLSLRRVFDEQTDVDSASGLTDRQRDTLVAAVQSGYLDVPRETSLAELADDLGVSPNAASERFRRAVRNLVCESLSVERDSRARKRA
ncbi:helix-turn-helix domain-containing protein [Halospeciosus flavus]|uniref:Helix-turn-helix domain-containing protein n=1 Tax=Halospeciosus flavus TaxID=3032283 RepID=A0ABD5Z1J2_9EURY|nr:helix-turn-helix domain-containing protein [Halospeciosus flavus]